MISRIASRPSGRSTRRSSRSASREVGDVAHTEADRRHIEGPVGEGKREQVALHPVDGRVSLRRARSSIRSEKSSPVTLPAPALGRNREITGAARPSSTRVAGLHAADAVRRRQRRSRPAVMTRFMTS